MRFVLLIVSVGCFAQAPSAAPRITLLQALTSTLQLHPLLRVQEEQVNVNRGLRQQANSIFDTTLSSAATHRRIMTPLTRLQQQQAEGSGILTSSQGTNLTSLSLNASKLYRNGISITPFSGIDRTTDNLINFGGLNQTRIGFEVNIPLLRGRGRDVVTARVASANYQLDASLLDLNSAIAELLSNTANSYWNAVAAMKGLDVLRSSEERGNAFVENVRALIDADKVPRNEINQVLANLANRTADRISAEQQVVEARQGLANAMGLPYDQMPSIGDPTDELPDDTKISMLPTDVNALRTYIERSLASRPDLLASRKRVEAARVLTVAARNQLLPQVNLVLSSGYSGLKEGRRPDQFLASTVLGVGGPDAAAGIQYQFPLANNFAQGQLVQAEAGVKQAQLRVDDISRSISAGVAVALNGVQAAKSRLDKARESVDYYQTALNGERDKYRLGIGSLVDVLTIEDRLTNATVGLVQAQLAFARVLIDFRFATGTIVAPESFSQSITNDVFLTLPFTGSGPEQKK